MQLEIVVKQIGVSIMHPGIRLPAQNNRLYLSRIVLYFFCAFPYIDAEGQTAAARH